MNPSRARLAASVAAVALVVLPAGSAHAQDAFGLETGLSTGLLVDPLTGHSPWRVPGARLQGGLYTGYASETVYGCELDAATDTCLTGAQPWVQDDWMVAGDGVIHVLDGRLSLGGGVRLRAASSPTRSIPAGLADAPTFDAAQWEDLRLSARWALEPGRRWSVAPVASLRIDRQTHLVFDPIEAAELTLGPLYGLGNGPGLAVPIGLSLRQVPLSFTIDPELGLHVSATETADAAADLGLNPLSRWARIRAGTSYAPTERLSVLAELEARARRDAELDTTLPGVEARVGVRRSLLADQLAVTALLGTSPVEALGSPGLRGGLSLRYTAGANRAAAPQAPTLPPGPVLRLSVTDSSGTPLTPEVLVDGAPVPALPQEDGTLKVSVGDTQPHTLTLRHPGHAVLRQTVVAPESGAWSLSRVLPPGGGQGVMVLSVADPTGQPVPSFDATLAAAPPSGAPAVDLGTLCGDCGLQFSELPEGPYALDLTAPGLSPGTTRVLVGPEPPAPPADTLFMQPPVGQLDIRVADETGRPIPGAEVRLVRPSGVSDVPLDAGGRALPVVAPGRWLVETTAPGRGRQLHELDVEPLVPFTHSLSVRMLPGDDDDAQLHVEVFDADGFPVPGADVRAGDQVLATTGTGGRVTLAGLPAGDIQLQIHHPDFRPEPPRSLSLVAGEERGASFALGWQPGAVVLRVVSPEGAPVDSTVRLDGPGQSIIERTGPDGRYSEVLPPGAWKARIIDTDRLPVSVDFDIDPARNTQVAMKLVSQPPVVGTDPTARLAFLVVDESDTPVEGALVHLGDRALGTTSTTGRLSVAGVPAGKARVAVDGQYFDPWTDTVDISAEGERVVQANLRSRLGLVELVAVDPNDQPIEAQVRVTGAGGRSRLARLGTDGRRSYRLATGYWEFAFASDRNGFGVEDLSVEREQEAYEVRWVGAADAPAAVLSPPEKRPVEVQLWSRTAAGPTPGTLRMLGPEVLPPFEVAEDGLWQGALRPGAWEALATAPGLGIGGGDLPVEPGRETVTLRVDLGTVEVELTAEEVTIDDTLYFGLGSSRLEGAAHDSLEAVARTLRSTPAVRRVRVEGHADQSGAADLNQRLSEERAAAVVSALVALGVEPHRLEARGYGETRPVEAPGADGGARSRRVVFRVIDVQEAVQLGPEPLTDGTVR